MLFASACASHGGEARKVPVPIASASAPKAAAPFVVAMVVDQLAAWMAAERFGELPKTGGFARLLREGTYARDMRYAHATTDTSPGHTALFTGMAPYRASIYANERIDDATRRRHSALRDTSTHEIDASGPESTASISLASLKVDTVADVLRARSPKATIISVSLKDRGAIFAGGRHPNAALWYDTRRDAIVTSSAVASAFPAWARPVDRAALARLREEPWSLLDPVWVASHAKQPDSQPGESDVFGFGVTFPHSFDSARLPPIAFRASPRGDEAVLRLAALAVDQRDASVPMLLGVSISSPDYVGHFYGPDSWEWWDEFLRLDGALAAFFALLDRKVGVDGWSLVLSGDHGAPPLPEAPDSARAWCAKDNGESDPWQRPCRKTGRIFPDTLADTLEEAAVRVVGKGEYILGVASPYVFYRQSVAALSVDQRRKLDEAVTSALLRHPEVDHVYPPRTLPCPPETDESVDALVCRSLWPDNKEALYVVAKKGSFFDTDYDIGNGMSHGGPYLFDRSVPLIVRAPQRARAGLTLSEPIGFAAYVRTVATLLGVPPPEGASEARSLTR
jgi:hypothetical protein